MARPTNTYNQKWIDGGQTYVIKSEDNVINVRTGIGATTIYLPYIREVSYSDRVLTINDTDGQASTNPITLVVSPQGANLINGATTLSLSVNKISAKIVIVNSNEYLANLSTDDSGGGGGGQYLSLQKGDYKILEPTGVDTDNGNNLISALASYDIVFLMPCTYDLGTNFLEITNGKQIFGIGNREDIVITSSNTDQTIRPVTNAVYNISNATISNSAGGNSFRTYTIGANTFDTGVWDNLVITAPVKSLSGVGTNVNGYFGKYRNILCTSDEVFFNDISNNLLLNGEFINCKFQNYSCGSATNGAISLSGCLIDNCTGEDSCFGSNDASGGVTLDSDSIIRNCTGVNKCFGYGTATLNGVIKNCKANDYSFLYSDGISKIELIGTITDCIGNNYCFGSSGATLNQAPIDIIGTIANCTGVDYCFGYVYGSDILLSGDLINCKANDYSFIRVDGFGTINYSGRISDCKGRDYCFITGISCTQSIGGSSNSDCYISDCKGNEYCFIHIEDESIVVYSPILIRDCDAVQNSFFNVGNGGNIATSQNVMLLNCTASLGNNFFYTPNGNLLVEATIEGCTSQNKSFVFTESGDITSNYLQIKNCVNLQDEAFAWSADGNTTINSSVLMQDCISGGGSFVGTWGGDVYFNGKILGCSLSNGAYGYSFVHAYEGTLTFSGEISDCAGFDDACFVYAQSNSLINFNGIISNCFSSDFAKYCFCMSRDGNDAEISFLGLIKNCYVTNGTYNFCAVLSSAVNSNLNGSILDCKSTDYSFGYTDSSTLSSILTIIKNCEGGTDSFLSAYSNLDINQTIIENCSAGDNSFAYSSTGTIYAVDLSILNCKGTDSSFVVTNSDDITLINSLIKGCVADTTSYVYAKTSGNIVCNTLKIVDCVLREHEGLIWTYQGNVNFDASSSIEGCLSGGGCYVGSWDGEVTMAGQILNCNTNSDAWGCLFGYAYSGILNFTGQVINCNAHGGYSFGCGELSVLTFSGKVSNCTDSSTSQYSFCSVNGNGSSFSFTGQILNCSIDEGSYSFGSIYNSTGSTSNLSGIIFNCISGEVSFGYNEVVIATLNIDGRIQNCIGNSGSFNGNTENNSGGRIIDCKCLQNGTPNILWYGLLENFENTITSTEPILLLGANAVVRRCILKNLGAGEVMDSFDETTPVNIKSYQNAMNKVESANITNLITTAYNVIDTNI